MEDRPSDRAHEKRYHHGGESSPSRTKTSLKNDPSQCQLQETQTKKTGNGKVNGGAAERECATLSASDSVGVAYPANGNGHQSPLDYNWRSKHSGRAHCAVSKLGSRSHRNGVMDGRSDRAPDLLALEGKELPALPNGVSLPLGPGFLTNGYPGNKPLAGPDNDGSGSESGYATPKKRKALRNGGSKGGAPAAHPPREPPAPEPPGPAAKAETRTNKPLSVSTVTAVPTTTPPLPTATCEPQRKNLEAKATGAFSKKQDERPGKTKPNVSATSKEKEDPWTLFKPPPVFPVDNSSAKIVPKISYASKVKENLNKAGGESAARPGSPSAQLPALGRPSQVPMSAMKTIRSSGFANGSLCPGEGNAYSLSGTLFASTVPPEDIAPPAEEGGGVPNSASAPALVVGESRKPGFFVYPLAPSSSNMQLALPSGRQADPPASPTPAPDPSSAPANQKALGDIFQNQWGLSFINEPSAGPEGGVGGVGGGRRVSGKGKVLEVTFQGDCPATLPAPHEAPKATALPPKAHEVEKRTTPQSHGSVLKAGPPPASPPLRDGTPPAPGPDGQKDDAEARSLGALVFASPKDPPTPTEPPRESPRAPAPPKGLDRGSWGLFDLKAAVNYHTKEMECILHLQKQDPKRVVLYGESKDGPNQ
ncbi:hypothetical protein COCON_G00191380 [Conger conger]|uniref:Nuclear fragile X mental retardation-interacting protein 2 n=1 Tax=Conger conger TaxID=82655 RepID=A0A9Q1D378_CONCO|nr:hypothetical protein COCON_G00191380 [Conger conger]